MIKVQHSCDIECCTCLLVYLWKPKAGGIQYHETDLHSNNEIASGLGGLGTCQPMEQSLHQEFPSPFGVGRRCCATIWLQSNGTSCQVQPWLWLHHAGQLTTFLHVALCCVQAVTGTDSAR